MSRLRTFGGEIGIFTSAGDIPSLADGRAVDTSVTLQSSIVRTGAQAVKCASGASNVTARFSHRLKSSEVALGRAIYARVYYYFSGGMPGTTTRILDLGNQSGSAIIDCRIGSDGKIFLHTGAVQIGSASTIALTTGNWYCIEMMLKPDTGSVDQVELRLNGSSVASGTGLNLTDAACGYLFMGWLSAPGANLDLYVDDVAINDDQSASQNSWPGEERVVWLSPLSDNARAADWLAGAGATSALYDALNNVPPVGVALGSATDTSQVKNAGTSATSNLDLNLTDYATAGVPASAQIVLVQAYADTGVNAAGSLGGALQIVSNPAQSVEDTWNFGDSVGVAGTWPTNWNTMWGAAQVGDIAAGNRSTQPVLRVGKRTTSATAVFADAVGAYVGYRHPVKGRKTLAGIGTKLGARQAQMN